MADEILNSSEQVYTRQIGDNLVLIDPNKIQSIDGTKIEDRLVRHEDLVIYVNLTATIIRRSKLISGRGSNTNKVKVQIFDGEINFLKPGNKPSLDSDWTDAFTDPSVNKIIRNEDTSKTGQKFISKTIQDTNDFQGFGITGIDIKIGASFIPEVVINFVDIRGKTLFEQAETNTPYTAFFHLPYPTFELTVKGYYGKAVKYQLMMYKFSANFDSGSGDYKVVGNFIGNHVALIADINIQQAMLAPYLYPAVQDGVSSTEFVANGLGRKILDEVYNIYKQKKLIPEDFPHLTILELIEKIKLFTTTLADNLTKVDLQFDDDQAVYNAQLKDLWAAVLGKGGWATKFLNTSSEKGIPLTLAIGSATNNISETTVSATAFPLIDTSKESIANAESKLKAIFDAYTRVLGRNLTFGLNKGKGSIETIKEFTVENQRATSNQAIDISKVPQSGYYILQYTLKSFGGVYERVLKDFELRYNEVQREATERLNRVFVETLEFYPSIRNLTSIVIAGVDTHLRLLDKVHTDAMDLQDNQHRIRAVTGPELSFKDTPKGEQMCFPWPQYYNEDVSTGELILQYPGAAGVLSKTKANELKLWPEVEYIEEYLKAITAKKNEIVFPKSNAAVFLGSIPISVREFPFENKVYDPNKDKNTILWEILDRAVDFTNYVGVCGFKLWTTGKASMTEVVLEAADNDVKNLEEAIKTDGNLMEFFSSNNLKYNSLLVELKRNSPEKYELWRNGVINTEYIINRNLSNPSIPGTSYGLYPTSSISNVIVTQGTNVKYVDLYMRTKKSEDSFFDFYPLNLKSLTKLRNKLSDGIHIASGTDFYKIDELTIPPQTKVYASKDKSLFFTNWNWDKNKQNNIDLKEETIQGLEVIKQFDSEGNWRSYYDTKQDIVQQSLTDGINNLSSNRQCVSMLNTPWFANAIYKAFLSETTSSTPTPSYAEAAYLFLNSLPVTSPIEKVINKFDNKNLYGGYTAQLIKQLAGHHELPYAFVLKLGSLWWNYKNGPATPEDSVFGGLGSGDGGTTGNDGDFRCDEWYTADGTGWFNYTHNGKTLPGLDLTNPTLKQQTLGFWPKLIDAVHQLITGKAILDSTVAPVADVNTNFLGGFNLSLIEETELKFTDNNSIDHSFYTSFVDSTAIGSATVPEIDETTDPYYVLYPSMGGLVNTDLSWLDENGNMITAGFDGSSRFLWAGAGYGSFDVMDLGVTDTQYGAIYGRIPKTNYAKRMNLSKPEQDAWNINLTDGTSTTNYEDFTELLSIFPKQVLDKFEQEFLNFSYSKNPDGSIIEGEFNTFKDIFKRIMIVKKSDVAGGTSLTEEIAKAQYKIFSTTVTTFLNQSVLYKHGSVNGFDIINTTNGGTSTQQYIDYFLKKGTLTTTLVLAQYDASIYPTGYLDPSFRNLISNWVFPRLDVGSNVIFDNVCSICFDFFINFNLSPTLLPEFTPIVKWYLSVTKNLNPSSSAGISSTNFIQILTSFEKDMADQTTYYIDAFLQGSAKIDPTEDITKRTTSTDDRPSLDADSIKLELYQVFKTFNDKWIAGTDVQPETIFERFLFLDRANRDIGNEVVIDIYQFQSFGSPFGQESQSVKQTINGFISTLCSNNQFNFLALPSYINFYNIEGNDTQRQGNAMFGAFKEVDYTDSSPVYLCQYVGLPSSSLDIKSPTYGYNNDSFVLDRVSPNPLLSTPPSDENERNLTNKVMAFAVDFGIPNQQVFESISVDQSEFPNTSESFTLIEDIGKVGSGSRVSTSSINLFNLYKSRSYKCSVSMMGNALIQPTTYFQLRYVPMFAGPYFIMDVNHNITPNDMTTTFTGVRVALPNLPKVTDLLVKVQDNLLKNLPDQVVSEIEEESMIDPFDLTLEQMNNNMFNGDIDITEPMNLGFSPMDPVNLTKVTKPTGKQIFQSYRDNKRGAHAGIDYLPKLEYKGQDIKIVSPVSGTITKIYRDCKIGLKTCGHGYGNFVTIEKELIPFGSTAYVSGAVSRYEFHLAHLSEIGMISSEEGNVINQGIKLGIMGNTGNSEAIHLHYEIRRFIIDENLNEKAEYLNPSRFDSEYASILEV